jgi:hypothetical protein
VYKPQRSMVSIWEIVLDVSNLLRTTMKNSFVSTETFSKVSLAKSLEQRPELTIHPSIHPSIPLAAPPGLPTGSARFYGSPLFLTMATIVSFRLNAVLTAFSALKPGWRAVVMVRKNSKFQWDGIYSPQPIYPFAIESEKKRKKNEVTGLATSSFFFTTTCG